MILSYIRKKGIYKAFFITFLHMLLDFYRFDAVI